MPDPSNAPVITSTTPSFDDILATVVKGDKLTTEDVVSKFAAKPDTELFNALRKSLLLKGKKDADSRQVACEVIAQLAEKLNKTVEPECVALLALVLNLLGDKSKKVQVAAKAAASAVFKAANPHAISVLLDQFSVKTSSWQARAKRLNFIAKLSKSAQAQTISVLTRVIPMVTAEILDIKPQVKKAAKKALKALCACCSNIDVVPLIPIVMSALEDSKNTQECVFGLASTTFVEDVDAATLAIICPILNVGLKGTNNKIKRACARIVDNMTTLVEDPRDVQGMLKELLPRLESASKHLPSEEAREVCAKACKVLASKAAEPVKTEKVDMTEVLPLVLSAATAADLDIKAARTLTTLTYVAQLICRVNHTRTGTAEVKEILTPYLLNVTDSKTAEGIVEALTASAICSLEKKSFDQQDEEDAEELCNCDFSLAYGNKVLLKKTRLRLHRGLRYGLIGKNESGKTSVMKAIAEHRVDGFPEEHELRTIYVETDIKVKYADMSAIEYIQSDPLLAPLGLTEDDVVKNLNEMGFVKGAPATPYNKVGTLSGGWRMKLALTRAMLLKADILLLDEPTNHLDTYNVKWVEDYLMGLTNVTSIMVSHDSRLLDRVCTNIIQIDKFKLNFFKGNLSNFVALHPKARAYFELVADKYTFHFPQPGMLEGVKSKGKAIMKMQNVSFTYPGVEKAQLNNVNVQVSLGSRVACVGVNGAGKSTMIKLLTGELQPDKKDNGKVWQHPNCRVGYIAQHAFHHINSHLDQTANKYVQERYRNGFDGEEVAKVTNLVSEAEKKKMAQPIVMMIKNEDTGSMSKVSIKVGRLTEGRRQNKLMKDQEYEVTIKDSTNNDRMWIRKTVLLKAGWEKMIARADSRIAMRAAMYATPLTTENIKKHFEDVGLAEEFSTHVPMSSLSGGQKVKVVLGAAMWNRPHILILDEPTNYLDRDSLGALAAAIREFEGGVVMITHNSQFCDNLCPTVWHLENNTLNVKGDAEWMAEMEKTKLEEQKQADEMTDKWGNTVKLSKKLNEKQQKKRRKQMMKINKKRKKQGLDVLDSDDEEWEVILPL
jgi:elongation factor 3